MRDSEMTRPLAKKSLEILSKYLDNKVAGGDQTRVALAILQTHVKLMATEANDDSNKLGLAKMIYAEPELRKQYIKKSMPHMITENK